MGHEADQGSRAVSSGMRPVHRSDRYVYVHSVYGVWLVSNCQPVLLGFVLHYLKRGNSIIFQQYVCYTTILNMFRAARCLSSGGQIVSPQPLVS